MPTYRTGTVTAILAERPGLQRVEVDGQRACVLTELVPPVAVGDRVVMNTTAVDLDRGTGGWHFVHWNLARDEWTSGVGDEIKIRYTSVQTNVTIAEGHAVPDVPVVACFLHSQLLAVVLAYHAVNPGGRLAYVMTDAGALPLALSDTVYELRQRGLLHTTVTAGHAFGGDAEATTVEHALAVAGDRGADTVVVGMGPGSLGVGSELAFTGREVAVILTAARQPIVALRYSDADTRPRHRGFSHHTRAVLDATPIPVTVPIPRGEAAPDTDRHTVVEVDVPDLLPLLGEFGATSMGRPAAEDPKFYAYAGAAGVLAAQRSQ